MKTLNITVQHDIDGAVVLSETLHLASENIGAIDALIAGALSGSSLGLDQCYGCDEWWPQADLRRHGTPRARRCPKCRREMP